MGGILGAGQAGVSTAINRAARSGDVKQLGAAIREAGAADALIQEAKARGGEAAAMAQRIEGKKSKSAAELGELYIQTLSQLSDAELEALSGGGGRGREGSIPENAPETAAVTENDRNGTENAPNVREGAENARTIAEAAPETEKTAPRTAENPRIGMDGTRYAPRAGEGPVMLPTAEEEMRFRLSRNAKTELERSGILAGVDRETISRAQSIADTLGRDIVFYSSGSAVENGYRDMSTGRIYINAQSKNPTMQIIAHELTHSIEESSSYDRLKKLVLGRIQQQGGDLDALRQAKAELYARHSVALEGEESIDAEIVAEYIEKNLLTDEESIISLVSEDRTLGQRILDFIDRILARLGNEDAQERAFLTRAREYYAKALEETPRTEPERTGTDDYLTDLREQLRSGEITDEEFDRLFDEYYRGGSEGQFSIERTTDNRPFVEVEQDILAGVPEADWVKTVKENLKKKFPDGITVGNNEIHIDKQSRREMTFSRYMQQLYNRDPQLRADKLRATENADEILHAATGWVNEGLKHPRKDNIRDFARGEVLLRVGGNDYTADVVVGTRRDGSMLLYDILNLRPTSFTEKETDAAITVNPSPGAGRSTASVSAAKISQRELPVKRKFSFAGERAKSADLEALKRAKEMREEDVAEDIILRETGWYVGADGKWRFEIDDSGMEFRRDGDARLMQEPEYKRLDELTEKWAASMESGGAPLTAAEETELEQLQEKYSDRVWDEKYLLSDFLKHDKLFEQYPMLKYMTLSFEKLDPGERGYYDRKNGKIVLDSAMLGGEKDTLIHEIQHVIQKIEGFTPGASPEYWARREYESGDFVTERLQERYSRLLNSLPGEEQNKYIRYTELDRELERLFLSDENSEDGRRYAKLEAEQDALYEELYPNKWFQELLDLNRRMNDAPGEYLDMYRNTAGEIEARDAASRKNLTAGERRERMPDRGDENTVFAENPDYAGEYVGTAEDGTEIYETSDEVKRLPVKQRMALFLDLMRNEYRGRTARFTAPNGEAYYAGFDEADARKNIYGDKKSSPGGWNAKINTGADGGIFELVENSRYVRSGKEQGKKTAAHAGVSGWEYFIKTVQIDGKTYDLLANIRKKPEGEYVYSIQLNESKKKASALPLQYRNGTAKAENRPVRMPTDAFDESIARSGENVNSQFSISEDSEGRELSPEQAEFFKHSAVMDEEGRLRVVYHTTDNDFTIFDRGRLGGNTLGNASDWGIAATSLLGHWFSDHDLKANMYTEKTGRYYLKIESPYRTTLYALADEITNRADNAEEAEEYFNAGEYEPVREAADGLLDRLKADGYDGIILADEEFGGTSYVIFDSNQAKLTSNENPTSSPDIRYSISERTPEEKREIFRNLQAYMNGKTDTRELRRYVDSLDESIDYSFREDSLGLRRPRLKTAAEEEAERIVRRASRKHRSGCSQEGKR